MAFYNILTLPSTAVGKAANTSFASVVAPNSLCEAIVGVCLSVDNAIGNARVLGVAKKPRSGGKRKGTEGERQKVINRRHMHLFPHGPKNIISIGNCMPHNIVSFVLMRRGGVARLLGAYPTQGRYEGTKAGLRTFSHGLRTFHNG